MHINHANLNTLFVAFKAAFMGGLGMATPQYKQVATVVPSNTATEEYGWLGSLPGMREWLGDRVVHGVKSHGYSIRNKPWELTVGVPRTAIEDDQYGVYTPLFTELGRASEAHPDQLVFPALSSGHSTLCYDGQYFFDTDHPVLDASGAAQSQSNLDNNSGSGTRWFLLDTSRAIKPIIFQQRKAPNFVPMTQENDEAVFSRAEFRYGVDSRDNVGYSLWQLAYCSRKTLDATNLQAAYTAMAERKGDYERPLGIRPNLLVVPQSLKFAALELLKAERNAAGATNINANLTDLLVADWLT